MNQETQPLGSLAPSYLGVKVEADEVKKSFILKLFSLNSLLTLLSALAVCCTQVISFIYRFIAIYSLSDRSNLSILKFFLQFYCILFCILVMLVELELDSLKASSILRNWISRGFIYVFVAILALDNNWIQSSWNEVLSNLAGYTLVVMGVSYVVMVRYSGVRINNLSMLGNILSKVYS
jgi:hypothetical protein